MGYYVTLEASDVQWKPETDLTLVLRHVQDTMFSDASLLRDARGGASPIKDASDVPSYKWYSWVDTATCRAATTIDSILNQFFDYYADQSNGEWDVRFDNKSGQEDLLMETLAPFIAAGSYMEWRGEDGAQFRWSFDGQCRTTQQGILEWR